MATFRYVGDHDAIRTLDLLFKRGEDVEVDDDAVLRKLRGNHHFVEVFGGVEVVAPAAPTADPPKRRGRPPKYPRP